MLCCVCVTYDYIGKRYTDIDGYSLEHQRRYNQIKNFSFVPSSFSAECFYMLFNKLYTSVYMFISNLLLYTMLAYFFFFLGFSGVLFQLFFSSVLHNNNNKILYKHQTDIFQYVNINNSCIQICLVYAYFFRLHILFCFGTAYYFNGSFSFFFVILSVCCVCVCVCILCAHIHKFSFKSSAHYILNRT